MSADPHLTFPVLAADFYRRLRRLSAAAETTEVAERNRALRSLIAEVFEKATAPDKIHFSTTYARISYATHKFQLSHQLVYQERLFRRAARKPKGAVAGVEVGAQRDATPPTDPDELRFRTGLRLATELTQALLDEPVPDDLVPLTEAPYPSPYVAPEVQRTYYQLRVLVTGIDAELGELYVCDERRPELVLTIPYGEEELADGRVGQAARIIRDVSGPYVVLNLIRAELRAGNRLYPTQIVIEPDFLVNVTDVANCFDNHGHQPWTYLAKKLVPFIKGPAIVRGNLVNNFLDQLIHDPRTKFGDLLPTMFAVQPLELCMFNDAEVRQLVGDLKHHFTTVRKVVREELPRMNIERETVMLEPSFMSPDFGLQGRLDLLQSQRDTEEDQTSIIELKTSKIFRPNHHKIKQDNFIQTLLYDLMINRALGREANVRSYILYSIDYQEPVRFAPPEFSQQMEALTARNQLVAVEMLIAQLGTDPQVDLAGTTTRLIGCLHPTRFKSLSNFNERDHQLLLEAYGRLDDRERRYLGAFMGFVAREQRLAKVGEQKTDHVNGLASLWLEERQDKVERFELLDALTFGSYDVRNNVLTLRRGQGDERLVKFRQGDVVALYPTAESMAAPRDPVSSQVFKSTLIDLTPTQVHLRPRNPQLSDAVFRRGNFWALEKDVLDSSFRNHYQGLFTLMTAPKEVRTRWLGLAPPRQAAPHSKPISSKLTEEQERIVQRALTAEDYFLLWGPPGTGKTSQMLHHLVRWLLFHTKENLLLIAYTNRAVDEICESLERIVLPSAKPFRDYLRIGSRFGADERFADRLLQNRSADIKRRTELMDLIKRTRIVVGTVASVGGKEELFRLKQFDRVIVDEASQIIEPLLAGILPRAKRALLIGDHRQLPAVVQQSEEQTLVRDATLRTDCGLTNLGTSLFERLYLTAQRNGWDWAYDQLSHQGRMHRDIMAFPALHFYQERLQILPKHIKHHQAQIAPLKSFTARTPLGRTLAERRLVFVPSNADYETGDPKVNRHEAELMVQLITTFTELYSATQFPIRPGDIGIITPYRAQIAYIRRHLAEANYPADDFTVDTVERYQGSAKRIILMSICANEAYQMAGLSQISEEGVDRKLNVAMTRAREHLVIVGCPDVLRESEVYGKLIDFATGPVAAETA